MTFTSSWIVSPMYLPRFARDHSLDLEREAIVGDLRAETATAIDLTLRPRKATINALS
jgi:hypothetical protein